MTPQTTLTEDAPMIVDLTCSTKRIWPKSATKRGDVDPEVEADFHWDGKIIPFPDGSVDEFYYDPPHMIGRPFKKPEHGPWFSSVNRKKYPHDHFLNSVGRFAKWKSRKELEATLIILNKEFARALKQDGRLNLKLSEVGRPNRSVQYSDICFLTNFILESGKITRSKFGKNPTYWLTMKPKHSARAKRQTPRRRRASR